VEIYRCLDCQGVLAIGTPRCPRCGGSHMRPLRNNHAPDSIGSTKPRESRAAGTPPESQRKPRD
jgi:hypothetical protein